MPAFFVDEGRCECVRISKRGKREKATDHVDDGGMFCGIWEDQDKEGHSMLIKWTSEVYIGKCLKIQSGGNDAFLREGVAPAMKNTTRQRQIKETTGETGAEKTRDEIENKEF